MFFALQRLSWSSDGPAVRAFGAALAVTHTGGSTEWWQLRGRRGSSNIACLLWQQKGVLGPVLLLSGSRNHTSALTMASDSSSFTSWLDLCVRLKYQNPKRSGKSGLAGAAQKPGKCCLNPVTSSEVSAWVTEPGVLLGGCWLKACLDQERCWGIGRLMAGLSRLLPFHGERDQAGPLHPGTSYVTVLQKQLPSEIHLLSNYSLTELHTSKIIGMNET